MSRAEWGRNDTGRRAKFYALTPVGLRRLETETARWRRSAKAVETVLDLKEPKTVYTTESERETTGLLDMTPAAYPSALSTAACAPSRAHGMFTRSDPGVRA